MTERRGQEIAEAGEGGGRRYSSPVMQKRRERIIEAARALIGEKGADGFSMLEVAQRAGVSEKTLYNAVGSRIGLVAQAVDLYQQELTALTAPCRSRDMDALLASLKAMCDRLATDRNWGRAISDLYFSANTDEATYDALKAVARTHIEPALRAYQNRGAVRANAPLDLICHQFATTAYGLLRDWAIGRLTDAAFAPQVSFALLAALSLAVEGEARAEIDGWLAATARRCGDAEM